MSSSVFTYVFNLKDRMSGPLRKIYSVSQSTYGKLISAQKHYNTELKKGNRAARQMGGSVMNLGNLVKSYLGYRAVGGFFKLGAQMEQTRITFQTLLQDVNKGNKMFDNINKMAADTPYTNSLLQKNASTMLGFGISETDTMKALQMIGDVASGNAEKFKSLTLAFSQTQSAGKLMGQDFMQFVSAGFNPLKVISDKTGIAMADLKDQMSKGAISAQMVSKAFKIATSEGGMYYKMMSKQSQTLAGKWSTLVGNTQNLIGSFGERTTGVFTKILDKVIALVAWIDKHKSAVEALTVTVGAAVAGYYTWIGVSKLWMLGMAAQKSITFVIIGLTRGWAVAQRALNLTMMANPIGLVIGLIAGLAVGVIYAWNKFEGFRSVILGTWEVVKGFGNIIKDFVINRVKELINGMTGLAKMVQLFFKGEWSAAYNQGKKSFTQLLGVESKRQAYESGKKIGEWYQKGAAKGANASKITMPDVLKAGMGMGGFGTEGLASGNPLSTGTTADTMTSIVGGGKKTVNINTTVERLVDRLYVQAATVQEGAEEVRDIIQAELNRALNGIMVQEGI